MEHKSTSGDQRSDVRRKLAVLGSTGSIGEQTLDIVRRYPEHFAVSVLSSNTRWEALAAQAAELLPEYAVIADERFGDKLRSALSGLPVKVLSGAGELARVTGGCDADTVVNALVGFAGLTPTVEAITSGKRLALANKESLVVAGRLVMALADRHSIDVVPIDSEHSAVFQCLAGETSPARGIILTASGGPFRRLEADKFDKITVDEALAHPNWEMGAKITIDSATMMNKGFEVIEARWLFGFRPQQIRVVVHPQSVIHSLVEFADGALKAQLGTPDMHLPIQYALTYPDRWPLPSEQPFSFADCPTFTFEEPDTARFPALAMAYEVLEDEGDRSCVLNAANEVAVEAFLEGRIPFTGIARTLRHALDETHVHSFRDLEEITACDHASREKAAQYINATF